MIGLSPTSTLQELVSIIGVLPGEDKRVRSEKIPALVYAVSLANSNSATKSETKDVVSIYHSAEFSNWYDANKELTLKDIRHSASATGNLWKAIKIEDTPIREAVEEAKPIEAAPQTYTDEHGNVVDIGHQHELFPKILRYIKRRHNVALVGPAGCGKTHLAMMVAKVLGLPFYFTGAIDSPYKLSGFIDAQGRIVKTAFRNAYEQGGLFLFDEIDGSLPGAVLAFNAALANGYADFPDGPVARHPNFVAIAASNTFWNGADRIYVGRNQLDGTSLDRFAFIEMGYDEDLELKIGKNRNWTKYVQEIRGIVKSLKIRHIVSPRASIGGGLDLADGEEWREVEETWLWKGLDPETVKKIKVKVKTGPKYLKL